MILHSRKGSGEGLGRGPKLENFVGIGNYAAILPCCFADDGMDGYAAGGPATRASFIAFASE